MQFTDEQQIQRRQGFHERNFRNGLEINKKECPDRLWWHFRMRIRNTTSRYIGTANPIGVFEIDLHELWMELIEAAKVTSPDDAAAEQLVLQVIMARELGHISRRRPPASATSGYGDRSAPAHVEYAITTSNERMWVDLPFLATDLQAFWRDNIVTMDKVERTNLAGICGRMSASGLCDPHITSCALILFREALETPRRTLSTDDGSEAALSDYTPAVQAWSLDGAYQILNLCMQDYIPPPGSDSDPDWRASGALLPEEVVGFSMTRWRSWINRLRDVEQSTSDEELCDQCRRSANIMNRWEVMTGGYGDEEERERTHRAVFLKTV